jgi:fermentation-respiration switch protein FrsA (DUF1100 family)
LITGDEMRIGFILGSLALVYAGIALAIYTGQRRLIYYPDTRHVSPAGAGLAGVSERVLETPDGERVVTWYAPAKAGQPTLLYFHGNAGSLVTRVERIRAYVSRGRGILMMTYRGYGGSSGTPSEAVNVADAKLAYDFLIAQGVRAGDIIVYGESLGSGVAIQVAAEKPARGLVLDAPYTSLADVGAQVYPWLPVRAMMIDRYDSFKYLPALKLPLLVVHGARDATIPVAMGQQVYELAGGPKEIKIFPEAGHADHYLYGSFDVINGWIDRLRAHRDAERNR